MPAGILIVDDEQAISWSLRKAFERQGHRVGVAASAESALEQTPGLKPDVVILDVRLPGLDGLSVLAKLRELSNNAPIIVITAHGNLSTAVRAVEGGAFDYLAKPFDLAQIQAVVNRALAGRMAETHAIPPDMAPVGEEEMVGHGLAMQAVFKRIALVAPTDASVLITGESGTGKELVARAVHRHSHRRASPFLPVHVASLNANLVESELFGHVKGAFTGAGQSKPGLLALANGGTVFLDELGDIPLPVQAKLLRVLEHQEVLPVGGSVPEKINVRILAATNADLLKQVNAGQFRHDLYFRLNVFEIRLPSLRDRSEDIDQLVAYFARKYGANPTISETTAAYLRSRTWPGNVRELRNAIEHGAIISRGTPLMPEHFPPPVSVMGAETLSQRIGGLVRDWVRDQAQHTEEPTELYDKMLQLTEPALLDEALQQTGNNRVAAARRLGLARATLRKLLTKYRPAEAADDE
ncbi:sigma-54-dependent transcriptional regulator [Zavarzinella formosa]|uniref:sigma-54-dependent transcriptional regulator n=1 Tax=Zavarzinella formosa TaxID=360055 RepID=UPI0002FA3C45|nr:sigma-54 dependent transcriptional regulator [Zavarzinella formosa]